MKVRLRPDWKEIDDHEHRLEADVIYEVIGIEADDYRLINENADPILYPPNIFVIINATEPDDWITEYGENGERTSYPPQINRVGFFEDYHDGEVDAVREFWEYVNGRSTLTRSS